MECEFTEKSITTIKIENKINYQQLCPSIFSTLCKCHIQWFAGNHFTIHLRELQPDKDEKKTISLTKKLETTKVKENNYK